MPTTLVKYGFLVLLMSGLSLRAFSAPQQTKKAPETSSMWANEDRITWPKTGVGIGLGPISGISLYHTYMASQFVQGLFAINDGGNFFASGDFCTIVQKLAPRISRLDPYFGFGLMVQRSSHEWTHWGLGDTYDHHHHDHGMMVGGRIPIGVNYTIPETPLMVTAELAPGVLVAPGTYATLQGMLAIRALF